MAAHDRIRLTGLLTEGPLETGAFPIGGECPFRSMSEPGPNPEVGWPYQSDRWRSAALSANMCSPLIVCTLIPRFELATAAGGREALASGPVALAPDAGREQLIGQASAAA